MFAQQLLVLGLSAVLAHAKVQFLGVGIAGGDFGCQIDGSCPTSSIQLPLSTLGGGDGQGQMNHFAKDDGVNLFRLPISWQYLVNNNLGGTLDSGNLGKYDQVMQACLATGAYCMIDIHNFARWNGGIIGQGGPTDDQFVSLWTQLATKYASNDKIIFELMNEPHDLDVSLWAQTCQKVVTAIRGAGATSQMILLPGTNFDSAATLVSSGSADALMAIRNPDGTTDNLLLDIHKYLDTDNSGTHTACVTDNVAAFNEVAAYLRQAGRKGLVSETGASSDSSCMTAFCTQNTLINQNSDVFVGLVGWAAGSFSTSYVLSLTPSKSGSSYVDNALMKQCLVDTWVNSNTVVASSSTTRSAAASTAAATSLPTTLLVAPASSKTGTATSSSSFSMPTVIEPSMVLGSGSAGLPDPTTLLLASGTPTPAVQTTLVASATSRRGNSSTSTGSASAGATSVVAAAGSTWQPAAASSLWAAAVVVMAPFLLW